jgi:hypothetical protein
MSKIDDEIKELQLLKTLAARYGYMLVPETLRAENHRFDDDFGLCPVCHRTDGCLNKNSDHVYFCQVHKKKWTIGSNLFSSWKEETAAEQQRKMDEIGFDDFEEVKPSFHPRRRQQAVEPVTMSAPANDPDIPF